MRPQRFLVLGVVLAGLLGGQAAPQDASALRARHAAMQAQLANNQFRRPLYLESSETPSELKGDIYAVFDQPFAAVGSALLSMDNWCDILILHLNVKGCRADSSGTLAVMVGRKHDQPLQEAYRVEFRYKVAATSPDYLHVLLSAPTGPMGTKSYRIGLEGAALDTRRVFLHMSYAYAHGLTARMALQGYLATLGRNKIGFTVLERRADGQPVHVGGVRGVVERNAMRYYLAIESYLGSRHLPPSEQLAQRLRDWYEATERYAPQLHEIERDQYLDMKRREIARQQAGGKR